MPLIRPSVLSRYLLQGQLTSRGCLRTRTRSPTASLIALRHNSPLPLPQRRALHIETNTPSSESVPPPATPTHVPLRKQLKDEAKQQKASGKKKKKRVNNQTVEGWELTVGIEIHAQLNTAKKLFSAASTSFNDDPNTHVAYFDLATPGSQPIFQKETLIPALRAALALGCTIQPVSRFDRKHYFHWDQPSGYQITQYYEPFARNGRLHLFARDGIAAEDGEEVVVRIKQIQMEQDTAKTLAQAGNEHWIDFNRVGTPLIEIITEPVIHHPATAAAFVRKVQAQLHAVDACISGMEAGGLRADVNVSVRRSNGNNGDGTTLGQRVEIKNLSSFRSVEDAIIAERDRQIALLENGGVVEGETRGWSIRSTETRRLRGKEGEVDYRYMPDPDVPPLLIGGDLVAHLRSSMGQLPDVVVDGLVANFGLTTKDALSLVALDGAFRIEYFFNVIQLLREKLASTSPSTSNMESARKSENELFLMAANWILHEFGRLTTSYGNPDSIITTSDLLTFTQDGECPRVPARHLSDLLFLLHTRQITGKVAKDLLWQIFNGNISDYTLSSSPYICLDADPDSDPIAFPSVEAAIDAEDLRFHELSSAEYAKCADQAVEEQEDMIRSYIELELLKGKGKGKGKLGFLVGRMIRMGQEERMDPSTAERVMRERIEKVHWPAIKLTAEVEEEMTLNGRE
ncbi:GatB/GatE catalytic domain-containing protein [Xylariaceae sp. FL0255]|nr:GatB/GatE catalytic domain-containing protein [Xylariaceae sp. FL0255]